MSSSNLARHIPVSIGLLLAALLVGACATVDPVLRSQASSDLNCDDIQVSLVDRERAGEGSAHERRIYRVKGCGKDVLFEGMCLVDGDCSHYRLIEGVSPED